MTSSSTHSLSRLAVIAALVLPASALAADKSVYSFSNRTPESALRELSTDRPDLTESPYTVDAGWWQVEMDLVNFTRDHDTAGGADVKADALSVASINLKVGLTSRVDLQTVIEPYTRVRSHDRVARTRDTARGFGDITSRLKINFWGNDGGDSAFAIMPFVKWPTNQGGLGNKSVEGGLIIPYAHSLPGGWNCGVMTELDFVRNETDSGYTTAWLNTITFGHDIAGNLGGYVELTHRAAPGADEATFDCGVTYGLGAHVQLDAGANFGLTRVAADLTVVTGLIIRF